MRSYNPDSLKQYWAKLAEVTDFWDFTGYTGVSGDPRYFYDTMHYRNTLGEMMLGYIFDDPDVYVPADFGHYTTSGNVREHAEKVFTPPPAAGEAVSVPILVYHHIDVNPYEPNSLIIPVAKFREDMLAIKEAGFNTIFVRDLIDYVDGKKELPDNPLVVTFDDGYLSNYEHAFPVLKELDMKMTISIIGWSVGLNEHRLPGKQFYPHFTWEQAKEMQQSGLVDIQNHTFDMHEAGQDNPPIRVGVLPFEDESTGAYSKAFREDADKLAEQIESKVGNVVDVFTYPMGYYTHMSEQLLKDMGYRATLSTKSGISTIVKGDPRSLFALKRINAGPEIPSEKLVERITVK